MNAQLITPVTKMKGLYFILLLLQVIEIQLVSALVHSRATVGHGNHGDVNRVKRQSSGPSYVIGEFSEVSLLL